MIGWGCSLLHKNLWLERTKVATIVSNFVYLLHLTSLLFRITDYFLAVYAEGFLKHST